MQTFASCPMCRRPFQVEPDTPQIEIDGRRRYLCLKCRQVITAPPAPNGRPKSNGDAR